MVPEDDPRRITHDVELLQAHVAALVATAEALSTAADLLLDRARSLESKVGEIAARLAGM